mgnify:CR=1 FL=1
MILGKNKVFGESPRPYLLVPGSSRLVIEENDSEINNNVTGLEVRSTGNLTVRAKTAKQSVYNKLSRKHKTSRNTTQRRTASKSNNVSRGSSVYKNELGLSCS